jgi:hypothetical protein
MWRTSEHNSRKARDGRLGCDALDKKKRTPDAEQSPPCEEPVEKK